MFGHAYRDFDDRIEARAAIDTALEMLNAGEIELAPRVARFLIFNTPDYSPDDLEALSELTLRLLRSAPGGIDSSYATALGTRLFATLLELSDADFDPWPFYDAIARSEDVGSDMWVSDHMRVRLLRRFVAGVAERGAHLGLGRLIVALLTSIEFYESEPMTHDDVAHLGATEEVLRRLTASGDAETAAGGYCLALLVSATDASARSAAQLAWVPNSNLVSRRLMRNTLAVLPDPVTDELRDGIVNLLSPFLDPTVDSELQLPVTEALVRLAATRPAAITYREAELGLKLVAAV
jgi:hypothetical protein